MINASETTMLRQATDSDHRNYNLGRDAFSWSQSENDQCIRTNASRPFQPHEAATGIVHTCHFTSHGVPSGFGIGRDTRKRIISKKYRRYIEIKKKTTLCNMICWHNTVVSE